MFPPTSFLRTSILRSSCGLQIACEIIVPVPRLRRPYKFDNEPFPMITELTVDPKTSTTH